MEPLKLISKIHELIKEAEEINEMTGLEKKEYVIEKIVAMMPEDQKESTKVLASMVIDSLFYINDKDLLPKKSVVDKFMGVFKVFGEMKCCC
jgi:hypothetical protein